MVDSLREVIRRRAGSRCEYCRLPESADEWPFHVDHIISAQPGGTDHGDNLCWACSRCNLFKGPNVASVESHSLEVVPLYRPRLDNWDDHFRFDGERIVGLTPRGRVTVRLLAMNTSSRMELRRHLIEIGEF